MSKDCEHIATQREWLDASGVLANGTEEEIKASKRAYRKSYKTQHKRKQRQENPEFSIAFSRRNGEHGRITSVALKHNMSVQSFIRKAALAYIGKTYLVPDRDFVARLAQLLSDCLNEVQGIAQAKNNWHWQIDEKYDAIENRICVLETDMRRLFEFPAPIERAVRDAVDRNPSLRLSLLNLLIHDRKNQDA